MPWLLTAGLTGALIAASPKTDAPPSRSFDSLPRPSVMEITRLLDSPERRVRATDPRLAKMLALGARRSSTFAGLLAALDRSDVIAYIEAVDGLPASVDGRLLLLPVMNDQRYVRIQVRARLPREEIIPLIAHELQHALEVAAAPDVRDEAGMVALYRRIGEPVRAAHAFDTAAARETGRRVRSELLG